MWLQAEFKKGGATFKDGTKAGFVKALEDASKNRTTGVAVAELWAKHLKGVKKPRARKETFEMLFDALLVAK